MDKYILTFPAHKTIARRHKGFELFVNNSKREHGWMRCAAGHADLLGAGKSDVIILEDDVMLCPQFDERLAKIVSKYRADYSWIGGGYCCRDIGLPITEQPLEQPANVQDWGTQCMWYSARARNIAYHLLMAYLGCVVATSPIRYDIPENIRPRPTMDGVLNGFDVGYFKALRELNVPVLFMPLVQHVPVAESTCLSGDHRSEFFPKNPKGKPGWW